MKTTVDKIEVMQAYLDGRKIQFIRGSGKDWLDWPANKEPMWCWQNAQYRVAPGPKKKVKMLAYFDGTNLFWAAGHRNADRIPAEDKVIEIEQTQD